MTEAVRSEAATPQTWFDRHTPTFAKDDGGNWAYYAVNAHGVPVSVIGADVVYGLRTTALRAGLARTGRDVSRLQFKSETDEPLATTLKP